MANTSFLSLGEAAKEAGKSKATISKYLKNGKLSYVTKDDNGYQIDPAELFRVFPVVNTANSERERSRTQQTPSANTGKRDLMAAQLELLQMKLEKTEQQLAREQENADHWREQAERVSLLLTDQRPANPLRFRWPWEN